jgi:cell division transport system permease protein
MKNFLHNAGYFIKEAKTIFSLNFLSNILSIFSIGLIFFLLAMVISGWMVSTNVIEIIKGEAEISAYYNQSLNDSGTSQLISRINEIDGVRDVRLVNEDEAYDRMVDVLGKEARVLEVFDDNPFSSFIEVRINLEKIDSVINQLNNLQGIELVRDNKGILDRLGNIAGMLTYLSTLVLAAVGISTLLIISHIIKLGIYNNRDQINTLRLLGAPEIFIDFPFLIVGLLLTIGGGVLASVLSVFILKSVFYMMSGSVPFIPLPSFDYLVPKLIILLTTLSALLGIVGSTFGILSARSE